LAGGEGLPKGGVAALAVGLGRQYPFLDAATAARLAQSYGSDAREILGDARGKAALGRDFGRGLSEAELRWLVTREWAHTAEDVLWRRTKLGLGATPAQVRELTDYLARKDAASDRPLPSHGSAVGPSLSPQAGEGWGEGPGASGRYSAAWRARVVPRRSAAAFATAVPSKKRGLPAPHSRTALPKVKSRKSSWVRNPCSTSS